MRALLRFVPAIALGAAIGAVVGHFAGTSSNNRVMANKSRDMPSALPSPPMRELLDEVAPLPELPSEPAADASAEHRNRHWLAVMDAFSRAAESGKNNPYRAELEMELIRYHGGDGTALASSGIAKRFPNSEHAFARAAAANPLRALGQVGWGLRSGASAGDFALAHRRHRAVLRSWLGDDPHAALLEVTRQGVSKNRAISDFVRGMRTHALMREWGELDPMAAAAALPQLVETGTEFTREHYATSMLEGWFEHDPAGARRWVEEDAEPGWRDVLVDWLGRLESGDPTASSDALWESPGRR